MSRTRPHSSRSNAASLWPLYALAAAVVAAALPAAAEPLPAPLKAEGGHWKLSFNETFDGRELDRRRWRTALKEAGSDPRSLSDRSHYGNRERQVYFDPEFLGQGVQPVTLRGGIMTITARPMSPKARGAVREALSLQPDNIRTGALKDASYTSGLISTRGRFGQRYGYFEMRARWDAGRGLWPAFWLLPAKGGWPPEIDIMESLGHQPDTIYQSVHSKAGGKQTSKTKKFKGVDTGQFQTYAALWTPTEIRFFVNGRQTSRQPTPGDAHKPMHLIVNLAVGGRWPGDPDETTRFPAKMEVDFVRAWTRETGS